MKEDESLALTDEVIEESKLSSKPKKEKRKKPAKKTIHHLLKKHKASHETKAIHVGIHNSELYRKEILQLAISTIEMLKHYEEYKHLREEKRLKIIGLKHVLADIKSLNNRLDVSKWPYVELRKSYAPKPKAKKAVSMADAANIIRERTLRIGERKATLNRLDDEIELLKRKLMEL